MYMYVHCSHCQIRYRDLKFASVPAVMRMQVQLGNITQEEADQALREMGLPPASRTGATAPEVKTKSNVQLAESSGVDTAPVPQEKARRRIGTNVGSSTSSSGKTAKPPPKPIPRPRPGRPPPSKKKPPPLPSKGPPIRKRSPVGTQHSSGTNNGVGEGDMDEDDNSYSGENEDDPKMGASLEIEDSDDGGGSSSNDDSELIEYNEEDELIADLVATSKRYVVEQRRRRSSVRIGLGGSGRSPAASSPHIESNSTTVLPHMALPGSPSPAVVNQLRRNASLSPNTARLAAAAAAAAAAVDEVGVDRHGQGGENPRASFLHADQTNPEQQPTDEHVHFNLATQLRQYYNEQWQDYTRAVGHERTSVEAKSSSRGVAIACTRVVQPPSADSYLNNWTSRASANAVVGSQLSLSNEILFETTCAHYLQMVNYEYVPCLT